jgi:hypothetical protein
MQAGISGLGKSVRLDNYQVMRDFFAYAISDISPKIEPIIAKAIPKSSKKHDPRYHTDICEYRDSLPGQVSAITTSGAAALPATSTIQLASQLSVGQERR